MKVVITIIITLAVAFGFALLTMEDPGYVVLARSPYTVRMPLALFVLFALVVFAALYLFFNLIAGIFGTPKRVRKWREKSNEARAQTYTMQGYAGLIEGNWSKAEKKLLINLRDHKPQLLNYLGAAYSAQQQGHLERRDDYLNDALAKHPKQRLAINLTRARLHYQAGEIDKARDVLEAIRKTAPRNVPAARLLAGIYRDLRDWNSLAAFMPALGKLKAFPPDEFTEWESLAYRQYLSSPALLQGKGGDRRPLEAYKSLPAAKRKDPGVIASYCRQLIKAGNPVLAEKTLRAALNRQWDSQLAYLYGKVETSFVGDQIKLAESWVKRYAPQTGDLTDLSLTLARLYRRDGQLDKARELFAHVLSGGGREEARAELGSLLEEMGDTEAALLCYRQGMPDDDFEIEPDADSAPAQEVEQVKALTDEWVAPDAPDAKAGNAAVMPVVR